MTNGIRVAGIADALGLKKCMEVAYAGYQQRLGGQRLPPMDVDYSTEIENYPTWVIDSPRGIIAGLIMVFDGAQATIANIAVDPKAQGQGIGRLLMTHAESVARERGFTELHLATHVLLSENIALYQYLGWDAYARNASRVLMRKDIRGS